jgi:hypothetical protein
LLRHHTSFIGPHHHHRSATKENVGSVGFEFQKHIRNPTAFAQRKQRLNNECRVCRFCRIYFRNLLLNFSITFWKQQTRHPFSGHNLLKSLAFSCRGSASSKPDKTI